MNNSQVKEALHRSMTAIVDAIKMAIEETPPELISDIIEHGITLAGGGGLIRGFEDVVSSATHITARLAEDPLTAVVRGTGIVLEDLEAVQEMLLPSVHDVRLR